MEVTYLSRDERVKLIFLLLRELKEKGYRFSTYTNLAREIWGMSHESLWFGDGSRYLGLGPKPIKKILLENKEKVEEIFGKGRKEVKA